MIEDARRLSTDTPITADIVIVGGGAAGIAMARDFLDTGLRVVVLESGGLTYDRRIQSLYRGRNVGLRYEPLDLCRVRMFGGSTDRRGWAGWCKFFDDFDFEERDWVALSGWPIAKRDLLTHYRRALETVSLPPDLERLAAVEAESENALDLGSGGCVDDPVAMSPASHLGEVWRGAIEASKSVRVLLNATVTRIDTDEAGRSATAVHFATLQNRRFHVAARFVVIAAGGIETARLLLLSDRTVPTGLGNRSGWVGRCFMDHPRFAWGQVTGLPRPGALAGFDPTRGFGKPAPGVPKAGERLAFGHGIAIDRAVQRREEILGSRTWIVPVAPQGERHGGRELREMVLWTSRGRIPADAAMRIGKIVADLPNAVAATLAHLKSIAGLTRNWQFVTMLEPEPDPDSRVTLDPGDRDAFGLPRVRLDWRLTPAVERSLRTAQRIIVENLRARGFECAIEGPGGPRANQKFEDPRWTWHHMGTARMSADPSTGVVDADCRVHDMENLYVAGSAVFPTCSYDMPTLTLIALAHRLSEHLRHRLARPSAFVAEEPASAASSPQAEPIAPPMIEETA